MDLTKAEKYEHEWKAYLENTHNKILNTIKTNKRDIILDASSGTGLLTKKMLKKQMPFKEMVLNEPDNDMRSLSEERYSQNPKIRHTSQKAKDIKEVNNYFTKILSINSFHLYQNKQKAIQKFHDILKPKGELILLDWNKQGLFKITNYFIKKYDDKKIETLNVKQTESILTKNKFKVEMQEVWSHKYWNLYIIKARK